MKLVLLFVVFFLFGIALPLSSFFWNQPSNIINSFKPAPATKFSIENAPSESLQGYIASMSGSINWLSRTASKPVQLKSPRILQQGEEISTGKNGNAVLVFSKYAKLTVTPDSHVSIIQLLPVNFVFQQDKGTVQYLNPFGVTVSIRSFDLLTLQTYGVITYSVDSENRTVTIYVTKGSSTEGYEDLQNNSSVLTVNKGQTYVFDEDTKTGTLQ